MKYSYFQYVVTTALLASVMLNIHTDGKRRELNRQFGEVIEQYAETNERYGARVDEDAALNKRYEKLIDQREELNKRYDDLNKSYAARLAQKK